MLCSFYKILSVIFLLSLLPALTGCQLLHIDDKSHHDESKSVDYSQYYLSLIELNEAQIADKIHQHQLASLANSESIKQDKTNSVETIEWQLKSVLFFALPHSSVHNPFTAKSKLNQLSLFALNKNNLRQSDVAFFSMLKTQLNQQILQLNELSQEKKVQQLIKQAYQFQQQQLEMLQQQINQLRKIEHNINEHGQ
ncbi:hypothetical protein [Colwellia hornerae]|uniref:Uncharacterized protein n=1 Tax=Colwellia hornerae TaxID=89402 RepID=A0A5C6Q5J1_9GAMM|nr:hypothetical protein [Colwellia hornerae]TWX59502.1 hypothetical protein ESZ28_00740 [Colwellia hornerae]TWX62872.1 hypothetical protein ESZ26_00735 [Colwellia hornerae]TWX64194.1 hypothetical protein ESZ27_15050 [Colwellia hornerae]